MAFDLLKIFIMKAQAYRTISWRRFARAVTCAGGALLASSCHPTPTIVKTSSAAVGGTIAGVMTGPPDSAISNRTISIVNLETGQRYETKTGQGGGYSMRVPAGTYRLTVELRNGEKLGQEETSLVLKNGDGEVGKTSDATAGRH